MNGILPPVIKEEVITEIDFLSGDWLFNDTIFTVDARGRYVITMTLWKTPRARPGSLNNSVESSMMTSYVSQRRA